GAAATCTEWALDGPLRDGRDNPGGRVYDASRRHRRVRGDGMAKCGRAKVQRAPAMDGTDVCALGVGSGTASDWRGVGSVGARRDLPLGGVAELASAFGGARATSPAACA